MMIFVAVPLLLVGLMAAKGYVANDDDDGHDLARLIVASVVMPLGLMAFRAWLT